MIYDGIKFILEETILSVVFSNSGEAFHFQGPDTKISGLTLKIIGLSLETALSYYYEITSSSDIESFQLDELPGTSSEFYFDYDLNS